jgi:hypothetical protein
MRFLSLVRFKFPSFLTYWFTRSLLLERTREWLVARRDWLPTKPEKFYNTLFNSRKRYGRLSVCLGAIFRRDVEEANIVCVWGCGEDDLHGTTERCGRKQNLERLHTESEY